MTIQRKYSLPNCTLVVEGLSDGTPGSQSTELRPLLSILVNAECYLSAKEQPLSGGRDFFESLVTATSSYAQEFLSKVHRPEAHNKEAGLVQWHKVDNNRHRLIVHSPQGNQHLDGNSSTATPTQIDLTTVQLFDLVEAVDQFFADSQTLPDMSLKLAPVPKRYVASNQPLVKQAVPAAVGVTSLSLAAIACLITPIPEAQRPTEPKPQPNSSATPLPSPSNQLSLSPTPAASASPSASDLEAAVTGGSEITDASQLYVLNRQLFNQINQAWKTRSAVDRSLIYRVAVAPDGAIMGYDSITADANNRVQQTPLPNLLYNPAAGSAATQESLAQFKVVFTNRGVLQVSPWRGYSETPKVLSPEITDLAQIRDLNQKVYDQIRQNSSSNPTYQRNLTFRVAMNKDGVITDYEPINQSAYDYSGQTPLPKMLQPSNALDKLPSTNQEPQAQFKVVFKPNGELEVTPWRGYR